MILVRNHRNMQVEDLLRLITILNAVDYKVY